MSVVSPSRDESKNRIYIYMNNLQQRGRMKEEELISKIQKLMEEQERLRIPIAQGLPWTTDEPEV